MPPVQQEDMSIFSLIANASLPVQIIMLILIIMSIVSWAIIISKYIMINRNYQQTKAFEEEFWNSNDLASLYHQVSKQADTSGPAARVFSAGMNEFLKAHRNNASDAESLIHNPNRAMKATYQRELDSMDHRLNFLASTGSVSPYIGLLGTVWGIMHSFIGLSTNTQATLAAVAPGIAEALIATAIGLFAAIPAVLGYNYFSNRTDQLAGRIDSFMDEFINILQRQVH
ncbi:protein TolQ [Brackiella oedipodis]|uniref:protein TolQ n=1 Tax=Brackiella oedipodis TaxID=124225 RepID=UPI0004911EFF|nr:protein TolQ [Brackiella oedipodis]